MVEAMHEPDTSGSRTFCDCVIQDRSGRADSQYLDEYLAVATALVIDGMHV